MNTHTKTNYRLVTIPAMSVDRHVDGESNIDNLPGATVELPFSHSNADAINRAITRHREHHDIPANVHVSATVRTVPLTVGTTVDSASTSARFHGRTV